MKNAPQWYDSSWLRVYYAARDVIAKVAPSRLNDFINSFDVLKTSNSFAERKLANVLPKSDLELIRNVIQELPLAKLDFHEIKLFGRFLVRDIPEFAAIQEGLTDNVSSWAGETVEPSYNFLSLYTKTGECRPHLDSPFAKWTLDVCISQSGPWPIYISKIIKWPEENTLFDDDWSSIIKRDTSLEFSAHILDPGQAILFSGSSQWHYRDPMPRNNSADFCDLLFMHFIPQGASEIVRPKNWASLFQIPELALISGIDHAL